MNYIEQVFRDKAKDEGCSILVSKWNYDSTLIRKHPTPILAV